MTLSTSKKFLHWYLFTAITKDEQLHTTYKIWIYEYPPPPPPPTECSTEVKMCYEHWQCGCSLLCDHRVSFSTSGTHCLDLKQNFLSDYCKEATQTEHNSKQLLEMTAYVSKHTLQHIKQLWSSLPHTHNTSHNYFHTAQWHLVNGMRIYFTPTMTDSVTWQWPHNGFLVWRIYFTLLLLICKW